MFNFKSRKTQYLVFAAIWAVLVGIASIQPSTMMWKVLPRAYMHDLAHVFAYGIFAYLFCFYLRFNRHFLFFKMTDLFVYFLSLVVTVLLGGGIELLQILTHDRRADWIDCFYNAIGALIGIMIFCAWHAFFHHRHLANRRL